MRVLFRLLTAAQQFISLAAVVLALLLTSAAAAQTGGATINLSQVFAGQAIGIKQVEDHLRLASFMHYDLGYFDDQTCRLEPIANPFAPKVLPMSPE